MTPATPPETAPQEASPKAQKGRPCPWCGGTGKRSEDPLPCTRAQMRVVVALRTLSRRWQRNPSIAEIARELRVSKTVVHQHLTALATQGLAACDKGAYFGWHLVEPPEPST